MAKLPGKAVFRDRVWSALQRAKVARFPGARYRIPNFTGAEAAARRLSELEEFAAAQTVKSNPDSPQLTVRALTLAAGKQLYMAVPRLLEVKPFLLLDPRRLDGAHRRNASIKGATEVALPVALGEMPHLDLIVCGTVAVNRQGVRIGKGGGFSDLEFALGVESGFIDGRTLIATTVHPLQLLDERLPETAHDFRVDLIVTPDEVIRCRRVKRPAGILWDDLTEEKIGEVPILSRLRETR